MKISEILKTKSTLSFEVFPPKQNAENITSIYHTIDELSKLHPDFISVTYGAGGSTKGKTVEIASKIKNDYHIEAVAHLTCITSQKEEVKNICTQLKHHHIENILALRGDEPKDHIIDKTTLDFQYAKDLHQYISQEFPNTFCLSGACYPEVHQEAACFEDDLKALKEKVDAGAEYLITQIFFDNQYYYRLVKAARNLGIQVPIIAGIMPVTNSKSLLHTAKMCGCSIPYQLSTMIESYYRYPNAMKEIGINYATHQIIDLITNGVDGIHIYTMNKPEIAQAIFGSIPTVLKELNHE